MPLAEKCGAKTVLLSPEVFSKITEEKSPDGIIAVVKYIDKLRFLCYNTFTSVEGFFCVLKSGTSSHFNIEGGIFTGFPEFY